MRRLLAVLLLLPLAAEAADLQDALASCARIASDSGRLACYDGIARPGSAAAPAAMTPAPAAPVAPAAASTPPPATVAAPAPTPAPSPTTPSPSPPPVASTAPAPQAGFGSDTLPAPRSNSPEPAPSVLRARLPGAFHGWRAGTRFVLDNGQVWECAGCEQVWFDAQNPAVTIERNFFGSYFLSVEGLNTRARVRRVQ